MSTVFLQCNHADELLLHANTANGNNNNNNSIRMYMDHETATG